MERGNSRSTPTIRGISRIEREFEASDRRRYFLPCPHCGHMQWLQFERLRWAKGQPDTAAFNCEGCEKPIAEHHNTRMLEQAAHFTEDGRLFQAIVGTRSTASWAAVPREGGRLV